MKYMQIANKIVTPNRVTPKNHQALCKSHRTRAAYAENERMPKLAKNRSNMASRFPSSFSGTKDAIADQIEKIVSRGNKLGLEESAPVFHRENHALTYDCRGLENISCGAR